MDEPPHSGPSLGTVLTAALVALSLGIIVVVLAEGISASGIARTVEEVVLGLAVVTVIVGGGAAIAVRMGEWRSGSEEEFEAIVLRAEALAAAAERGRRPTRGGRLPDWRLQELDVEDDDDFAELVRDALDDLPDPLHNAMGHVAIIVSDDGASHGAYGLYIGDGAVRDDSPDRVIIFRDTLRRDFGDDPRRLREEVVRTVRHELAHHAGFDEMGVSRLDL